MNESWTPISETIADLKNARENLQRIEDKFSNEPFLRDVYSQSAKELIETLESHLEYQLNKETGSQFSLSSANDDIDVWVRIEGDRYAEGRGPISSVGSYLKKMNSAAQHTFNILKKRAENVEPINFDSYFELADTAKGSLKLGLKNKIDDKVSSEGTQATLFEDEIETKTERLEMYSKVQSLSSESLHLLLRALSSAEDEEMLQELVYEYGEDDVIKLFHYARELAPSSRSNIQSITFEGKTLPPSKTSIITNKDTRKHLRENSKKLFSNKEFIAGTALIEEYKNNFNHDYYTLSAKPLKYKNKVFKNIELRLKKKNHRIIESEVLNQFFEIEGFIIYNSKGNPDYVEVDLLFNEDDDTDFDDNNS